MGLLGLWTNLKRAHDRDVGAAMTGVKPGDRVLIAGHEDVRLAVEVATTSGLNGRVVVLASDRETARRRATAIEEGGGLAEPLGAPLNMLPLDSGTFDVAIAEDTLAADVDQRGALAELFRVLRPGGRLIWIERQPRGGLFRLAPDSRGVPAAADRERALSAAGFRGARTLAEADGRVYVEGIKANQ